MVIVKNIKSRWKAGGFAKFELILATLFCLALIPTLRNITEENDVNIFYKAAETLRQGKSMYAAPHMYGMWYYYSPLFASLLVPFTFFKLQVIKLVWLSIGVFLVFRSYKLLLHFLPVSPDSQGRWFIGTLALLALHPVFLNLLYGQMTVLILWCCLEGIYQIQKNHYARAALSYAVGINIKLLPLFFFYSYLLRRNIRFLMYLSAAVLLLVLVPYLFLSPSFHTELIVQWIDLINPGNDEHINTAGEGGFIDFASLITKYFTSIAISTEGQLNIANLTEYEVYLLQTGFRILILLLTAFMFYRVHRLFQPGSLRDFADMAFVLLCIITAFPHQRDYSVLMALPAVALLSYSWFIWGFRPGNWLVALTVVCVIFMGFVLFPELLGQKVKYFNYEKRVPGIATLIFIPLYMLWTSKLGHFIKNSTSIRAEMQ